MDFGVSMFMTDYAIGAAELARALEERGFESLWNPEHSHIPLSRKTPFPGGGDLPKMYYDAMDPFVTLSVAAAVTTKLKVGTGVCLVIQRDTIQTAKLVASIDQTSKGRFLFGIGGGWNQDEMEDHGTVYATPLQADARADRGDEGDLDREQARVSRRDRRFPADDDVAEAGAEAAPAGHSRRRLPARGAARDPLRQWLGPDRRPRPYGQIENFLPPFKEMLAEAGRSLDDVPITMFGVAPDADLVKRYRDMGVARVVGGCPPEPADKTLPLLDKWVGIMRQVNG